ncbi:MAG: ATP-binding protein [Thermodesulfobacteriota bacterium]
MTAKNSNTTKDNTLTSTCCGDPAKDSHASLWEQLCQSFQDPVLVVRPDGIIIEANPATMRAAGKERQEIIGQGICKIIHGGRWPHIKCPLEEFLLTCRPRVEETRLPGFTGEYQLTITPIKESDDSINKIMLHARELTGDERRKVDSMRTAQLAAIGELAAGVAHEVNNPINGIINFAQLLLDDSDKDSSQAALLEKIVAEGDRIATIIHNLLSFAREGGDCRDLIDPVEVISESLSLIQHQLKKDGIQLTTDFPENRTHIGGNFRQMQQVILNLLSNSRYALNQRFSGNDPEKKLSISCFLADKEGLQVYQIRVRDQGTGMPQSILEKLFTPFFSTKPSGEGTGLGLSISYGIIKDHGGDILVNSRLNQYTEMIITLPLPTR